MATTKIWAIKDSVERVLNYAANPEKTVDSDLINAINYAENEAKTENRCYVTGVNCNAETAFEEMKAVQERFGKTSGNVAYHAYQSFKTGEITPELCHKIGIELAKKMWGNDYQVLVVTHLNTGTLHNHFVINSVNMWSGKKFDCNEGAYWKLRALSDELCTEHRLTVIKNPSGKTPRSIYFAEKNGKPLSPEMREAWRHLDRISQQISLLSNKKLNTLEDVEGFIKDTEKSINQVADFRTKIYNKLRRCTDEDKRNELLSKRDDCTETLKQLRMEKEIAITIIEDNPRINENISTEMQAQNLARGRKSNYRKKEYER